jgi:hypothetical protein
MLFRTAVTAAVFVAGIALARPAAAQTAAPPPDDEWKIIDNSFLVEEAFNQDPHVVQNIFTFQRQTVRDWQFTFTQEWPVPYKRHQLSYTIPVQALDGTNGMGDVLINYRLQVMEEGEHRPAFSPRVSVILPSGSTGAGAGTHGVQVNLPFSKRAGDWYVHGNAGYTWQRTQNGTTLTSPAAAGSVIYRARQMLNLMLEAVVIGVGTTPAQATPNAPAPQGRVVATTLSPGVRGGWNIGDDKQIVIGTAAPITHTPGETTTAVFLYFSYEGPVKGLPRK